MRIVAYIPGHTGPSYHRITLPLNLLPEVDICVTNNPAADYGFEKGCDLFLWNRVLPQSLFEALPELKEKYGFCTVCDLDDHWDIDEHHVDYQHYADTEFARRQLEHIRAADLVTVTHNRLADAVQPHNSNVEVLPNAIPKMGQFDIARDKSDLVRLFWQGSVTHQADLEVLQQPLRNLGPLSGKFKMILAGYDEGAEEVWFKMARTYTAGFKSQYKIIDGTSVLEYYGAYKYADVCLVPLVRSKFNSYKSNLKVLEAGNLGLPVIASMVDPYLDLPIYYCSKGRDWIKHIADLVQSGRRRDEAGKELAEFCQEHYNFFTINQKRKEIFEYESSKAGS